MKPCHMTDGELQREYRKNNMDADILSEFKRRRMIVGFLYSPKYLLNY